MKIRKADLSDAKAISELMLNDINLIKSKKYSREQILAMKDYASEDNIKKYLKKKNWKIFVAENKDKIIWIIGFEGNLLFSPYVADSENFVKDPYGERMLDFAEDKLRNSGESIVKIISLDTTRNYFEKKGFKVAEKLVLGRKVKFNEFMMEKKLK